MKMASPPEGTDSNMLPLTCSTPATNPVPYSTSQTGIQNAAFTSLSHVFASTCQKHIMNNKPETKTGKLKPQAAGINTPAQLKPAKYQIEKV